MVEMTSYTWRPYGKQTQVHIWNSVPHTPYLKPCEIIGPTSNPDMLHFLKVSADNDISEDYIPLETMVYTYTTRDVQQLMHLTLQETLAEDKMSCFRINKTNKLETFSRNDPPYMGALYQVGDKFILPPIEKSSGSSLERHIQDYIGKLKGPKIFQANKSEIILPYNSGSGWAIIHAYVNAGKLIITYIDSVRYNKPHLQELQKNIIIENLQSLKAVLKQVYGLKASKGGIQDIVKVEVILQDSLGDEFGAGALTIENIIGLTTNKPLQLSFDHNAINGLRHQHHIRLFENGLNFDLSPL